MKILRIVLAALLVITLFAACATKNLKEAGPYETTVKVEAHKAHEDCFKLMQSQSADYIFKASGPLDFNLHYHENGKVISPVDLKAILEKSGTFTAEHEQDYCLMWVNKNPGDVSLSYDFTISGE